MLNLSTVKVQLLGLRCFGARYLLPTAIAHRSGAVIGQIIEPDRISEWDEPSPAMTDTSNIIFEEKYNAIFGKNVILLFELMSNL